jgi:hypothetical protein
MVRQTRIAPPSAVFGASGSCRMISCRPIADCDLPAVVDLLSRGFRERTREFWTIALDRLAQLPTPAGYPKYGCILEVQGMPVGVLLLIYSRVPGCAKDRVRCNVSSWYVEPEYRSYAAMLVSQALKHKEVTYFNISPAPNTLPILAAQGYRPFSEGQFVSFPAALAPFRRGSIRRIDALERALPALVSSHELELLRYHAGFGCLSVVSRVAERWNPFVFISHGRVMKGTMRLALLIYCRNIDEFIANAGPLGRYLLHCGFSAVALDAAGPISGVPGYFTMGPLRLYRGPHPPRLGDLAFTELPIFGL